MAWPFRRVFRVFWWVLTTATLCALPLIFWEFKNQGFSPHYQAWFIAGLFVVLTIPIAVYEVAMHTEYYTRPRLQRHVIRILWMVPIYSVDAWLALRFKDARAYLDPVREIYEAYVIYNFYTYLTNYLEDELGLVAEHLEAKAPIKHLPPFDRCLPPWRMGQEYIWETKKGVTSYVIMRPLCTALALVTSPFGAYAEGDWSPRKAYPYLTMATNVSQMWALYCLIMFYHAFKDELAPIRPLAKFLCIKAVVFLTFWQGLALNILVAVGAIKVNEQFTTYTATDVAEGLQDFLICIEMFLAALAHAYAFPPRDYIDPNIPTKGFFTNVRYMFDLRDVVVDVQGVLEEHLQSTAETGKAALVKTAQGLVQTPGTLFQMLGAGGGAGGSRHAPLPTSDPDEVEHTRALLPSEHGLSAAAAGAGGAGGAGGAASSRRAHRAGGGGGSSSGVPGPGVSKDGGSWGARLRHWERRAALGISPRLRNALIACALLVAGYGSLLLPARWPASGGGLAGGRRLGPGTPDAAGGGGGEWLPPALVGAAPSLDPLACVPQLLVIGVMKGGTTALFHYLNGSQPAVHYANGTKSHVDFTPRFHPAIIGAHVTKELHFFDKQPAHVRNPQQQRTYFASFPGVNATADSPLQGRCSWPAAAGLTAASRPGLVRMEATAMYLAHPNAAGNVRALLPQARLVALLREPVSRALSSVNMLFQRAPAHAALVEGTPEYNAAWQAYVMRELTGQLRTLRACFAQVDPGRPMHEQVDQCVFSPTGTLQGVLHIHVGLYAVHLARWLAHFPAEQLLLWSSNAFEERPREHMEQLVAWLGLDPALTKPDDGGFKKLHERSYPTGSLPPALFQDLAAFFEPHNAELFALLQARGYGALAAQLRRAWTLERAGTVAALQRA
ncbi:hypothetical protein HT031_000292 [Scenedesmus sp. PABB004]|nr:hypothetical protein HT031_000292 [Scenedesmus sp. PABB004]